MLCVVVNAVVGNLNMKPKYLSKRVGVSTRSVRNMYTLFLLLFLLLFRFSWFPFDGERGIELKLPKIIQELC